MTGPVFIVGASRSGTALMRSILNGHSSVFLAGETHFFDDLRPRIESGVVDPTTDAGERVVQDYFLALSHRPYGHRGDPEQGRIRRETLVRIAARIRDSHDRYFEAYCQAEAELQNATVWGEKTPRHVFRIHDILQSFPVAKVICMVRDARAVIASYRDWKNQGGFDFDTDPGHRQTLAQDHERARRSYHIVINSLLWKGAAEASLNAPLRFGADRAMTVRYEDVACGKDDVVRQITDWIGVSFETSMMQVPMHNSSYTTFDGAAGIRSEAVDRWRSKLTAGEIATVESVCRRTLVRAGYELVRPRGCRAAVIRNYASTPLATIRAARANRERINNLPDYIRRRIVSAFPS
ncbi:MAG: sulfotransferase family protein [Phycisphaerales bacterium]